MPVKNYKPIPVFDTLSDTIDLYKMIYDAETPHYHIKKWLQSCFANAQFDIPKFAVNDYKVVLNFLYSYRGSSQTFAAYRRELERLIQWSWFVREKSILTLKRDDMEAFIEFCIKPYKRWIGTKTVARFTIKDGAKVPNPQWHPFDVSISKSDIKLGKQPNKADYQFSQKALKALFAIISSFYNYCSQEEIATMNPVTLIRQKSKFLRQEIKTPAVRRLTNEQWRTVISLAKEKAKNDIKYERTVFILSCLYGMYLRISELTATPRWTPRMGDFFKDNEGNWWFKTVGKGNKARQIAVSVDMLKALKHYRITYLELPPYPSLGEPTPLIGHTKNSNKPMTDPRTIRRLVQTCFDAAAAKLEQDDDYEAVQNLRLATVHWLRHTGISEDVKLRPREHVRDDAGHSSGAVTDHYIDVELSARAKSAKSKKIIVEK